ncbi:MAG: hypothetical protein J1F06_03555 [Prevotellaceae bacterium]|nr:hypothetical protein [Prevotellaceae bacterium]
MERKKTNAALVFAYRKMLKINAPEADDFRPFARRRKAGKRAARGGVEAPISCLRGFQIFEKREKSWILCKYTLTKLRIFAKYTS